jgi:hypothetical protein
MSKLTRQFSRSAAPLAVAALLFGCSDDSADDGASAGTGGAPTGAVVTFTDDIHPILQAKCGNSMCHDGSRAPVQPGHGAADVQVAYDATQAIGQMGQPVYERILLRITSDDPSFIMPPSYAVPPCEGAVGAAGCINEAELALIQAWIDAGTPL